MADFKRPYNPYKQRTQYVYEDEPYENKCVVCGKFLTKKSPICFSCPMDEFKYTEDEKNDRKPSE